MVSSLENLSKKIQLLTETHNGSWPEGIMEEKCNMLQKQKRLVQALKGLE